MSVLKVHMTYQCTARCEHCRFRCDPNPKQVIDYDLAMNCIRTLKEINDLQLVVFMGGEPGLFPDLLNALVRQTRQLGPAVRVETNAFWATTDGSARAFLSPLYAEGASVMLSLDGLHEPFVSPDCVERAIRVSRELRGDCVLESAYVDNSHLDRNQVDMRTKELIDRMRALSDSSWECRLYKGPVFFVGRSCDRLADTVSKGRGVPDEVCDRVPWWSHGDQDTLDLLILDAAGYLSKGCGIAIGNVMHTPPDRILATYDAHGHPIIGTLLERGPLGLALEAQQLGFTLAADYADRCHLCQEARNFLRTRYPEYLVPPQHYPQRST